MESSEDKAAGALQGAGQPEHSQENSTSKRTSRKKAQRQSRRRQGEYSKQKSDARALSSLLNLLQLLNAAAAIADTIILKK